VLATGIGAAGPLVACAVGGPATGAGQGTGAAPATAGPVTLRLWVPLSGEQEAHQSRVNDRFTGDYPRIAIEQLVVPDADQGTKLATAIAGHIPPDLAVLGGATRIADLIEHQQVVSLSRYRRDLARLDWYDAFIGAVVRGDDLYALPVQAATLALFYNADLYAKAGLDPAAPPATWEALLANAQAIARPEQQLWGHSIGTKPFAWTAEQIWVAYLWQAGGEWLSPDGKRAAFNGPAGVEALQLWTDLVQKYQVAPQKAVDNLVMGSDFETGTVGQMTLYSVWAIREEGMKFPVRTALLPHHRQAASVAGIVTVPIFSGSKQQDAAWTYLDWLSQPDHEVLYLSGLGTAPPRAAVTGSQAWTAFMAQHPLLRAFAQSLPQARLPYYGPGAPEVALRVAQAIETAVYGQKTPKQALDDAAREADAILARA
jgi:sn-glycerol 3-phosphate transport system substrate-binding protein